MTGRVRDPADYLDDVCAIARDAAVGILEVYKSDFKVMAKDDLSPLTLADHLAHDLIVARLSALTPEIPVISEESTIVDYATRASWQRFWLVDPLDGTKEFVARSGEFTVNIAMIENGRPIFGLVHVPVGGDSYYACRGQPAFHRDDTGVRAIRARRYDGGRATVAVSRRLGKTTTAFLSNLGEHDVLGVGSSVKFCLIAAGRADVYPRFGPTMEWDTAAAQCILEQAGGRVTDVHGQPLIYNKADMRNPWFIACGAGDYAWTRHLPATGH